MQPLRLKKIANSYREELSQLLLMEIKDPCLTGVRINTVKVTPDLRLARVYFVMSGGRSREREVLKGFLRCKSFIKRELAARVRLRYTPDLEFFYDESEEEKQRLEELFQQLGNHDKSE